MNAHLKPDSARCELRTYKAGALSALGHDLLIRIEEFQLDIQPTQVAGSFDVSSLVVVGTVCGGQLSQDTLSNADKTKINRVISRVLEPEQFPTAKLVVKLPESEFGPGRFRGQLTLRKTTRWINIDVTRDSDIWSCRVRLQQPDFQIRPYRAVMGTLRMKPEVDVEFIFEHSAINTSYTASH
jgi:hypothetical protein